MQVIGGYFLHKGMIAEMVTGEGEDPGRHVARVPQRAGRSGPYRDGERLSARRDMEWMGPLYLGLGLTVGAIQANMDSDERKVAYDCDITYGDRQRVRLRLPSRQHEAGQRNSGPAAA